MIYLDLQSCQKNGSSTLDLETKAVVLVALEIQVIMGPRLEKLGEYSEADDSCSPGVYLGVPKLRGPNIDPTIALLVLQGPRQRGFLLYRNSRLFQSRRSNTHQQPELSMLS